MRVELNLFASLKRYLPGKSDGNPCIMEVTEGTSVQELLDQFSIPAHVSKIIFLNGIHATGNEVLKDGDRLGVFPPVAGG